jgi:hypothetical protein
MARKKQKLFLFDPATEATFTALVELFTEQRLIDVLPTTGQPNQSLLMRAIIASADPEAVKRELQGLA